MSDILVFYSKSRDAKPGKGKHERVVDESKYSELAQHKDWRKVLSNFHESEFIYQGRTYTTIEAGFQAMKFKNYPEVFNKFSDGSIQTGLQARKARKSVILSKKELHEWDEIKDQVMKDISIAKYQQSPYAQKILHLTKDAELWHIIMRVGITHFTHLEWIRNNLAW